ncbi:hypothetical protein FRC03_010702 [Tulasnella sp. 419]|nr:hypothetical protein FRC03_010702 [Tulasnella sp. 419]
MVLSDMAHVGDPNFVRLRDEVARLFQSNPTAEKLERARRALEAIHESSIPFNSYSGQYHQAANLVFRNLLDHILDNCSFRDIVTVSQLSRSLRVQTRKYLNRQLVKLLKRYVSDVGAFFEVMKKTGGIISGSTALALIDRGGWKSRDLDLYVPEGQPRDEFLVHLAREGYDVTGESYDVGQIVRDKLRMGEDVRQYAQLSACVTRVTKLHKGTGPSGYPFYIIDLIESKSDAPPILPILYFNATHVMNWITHDSIVILYPSLTLNRVGVEHYLWDHQCWRIKYTERGFSIENTTEKLKLRCGSACPLLHRTTVDAGTLTFALVDGPITIPSPIKWQTRGVNAHPERGICKNPQCPRNPSFELRRSV